MTAQEAVKYLKMTKTCGELQKRMCGVAIKAHMERGTSCKNYGT